MSVSFDLKPVKRLKLVEPAAAFAGADLPEVQPPQLTPEEALAQSEREQNTGEAYAAEKNFSKALRSLNRALALTPERAVLHEAKAQALLEVDEIWAAVQCATRAAELAPDWPEAHMTLGRANLELGEPELALSSMEEVLTIQPTHVEATAEILTVQMLVQQRKEQNPAGGQRLHVVHIK